MSPARDIASNPWDITCEQAQLTAVLIRCWSPCAEQVMVPIRGLGQQYSQLDEKLHIKNTFMLIIIHYNKYVGNIPVGLLSISCQTNIPFIIYHNLKNLCGTKGLPCQAKPLQSFSIFCLCAYDTKAETSSACEWYVNLKLKRWSAARKRAKQRPQRS